jgi:hypothetical protein
MEGLDEEGTAEVTVVAEEEEGAGEGVVDLTLDPQEGGVDTTTHVLAMRAGETEVVEAWADPLPAGAHPPHVVAARHPAPPRAAAPGRPHRKDDTVHLPGGVRLRPSDSNAAPQLLAVANLLHRGDVRLRHRATAIRGPRRQRAV